MPATRVKQPVFNALERRVDGLEADIADLRLRSLSEPSEALAYVETLLGEAQTEQLALANTQLELANQALSVARAVESGTISDVYTLADYAETQVALAGSSSSRLSELLLIGL